MSALSTAWQDTLIGLNMEDRDDKLRDWNMEKQEQVEKGLQLASEFLHAQNAICTGTDDLSQFSDEELRKKAEKNREFSRKCLGFQLHLQNSEMSNHSTECVVKDALLNMERNCKIPGITAIISSFHAMMSNDTDHWDGVYTANTKAVLSPDIDQIQDYVNMSRRLKSSTALGKLELMADMAHNLGDAFSAIAAFRKKRLEDQTALKERALQSEHRLAEMAPLISEHALRIFVSRHTSRVYVQDSKGFDWAGFSICQLEKIHSDCEMTRDRFTEELAFRRLKSGIGLPMSKGSLHLPNSPQSTMSCNLQTPSNIEMPFGVSYYDELGDPFDPCNGANWDGDQQVGFRD